ncbi:transposase domain-containing protein [Nonomuraea sp. NPDC003709]|uniref:transposase domain-containing protein n=1 Tax=Nonomuraea sp. NPDC003709 TaxID=3154450 RepID=UPI0033B3F50D
MGAAVTTHGCRERRVRKLPAYVVVYLLIALCLYPGDGYEEVAEKLTGMTALVPGAPGPGVDPRNGTQRIADVYPGQITRASCRPPGCRGLRPGRRRRGTSGSGRSTCARPAL